MRVILIHGINNQGNSAEVIAETWVTWLKEGVASANLTLPDGLKFEAAFYGDLLHEETEAWAREGPRGEIMGIDDDVAGVCSSEIEVFFREIQERCGLSDDDVIDQLEPKEQTAIRQIQPMARGWNKRWIKAILRAIETKVPGNGRFTTSIFAKQAATYLFKPMLRETIDRLVETQVLESVPFDERVIVIGHSLGSVISYGALRRRNQLKVRMLMTLGSPLGSSVMKRALLPPLICLENVEHWVNGADPEDAVAIQPSLTRATFGCDRVSNLPDLDNGYDDPHAVSGYLRQAEVGKALHAAVRR